MRLLLKLAWRNVMGAGVRTWLNVFVISIALVAIVWNQGLLVGTDDQVARSMMDTEYGNGQFWQQHYDRYDPLTIDEAHAPIPSALRRLVDEGRATTILIGQGTIYPKGRLQAVQLKGIDPGQKILSLPTSFLAAGTEDLPALIGSRMARSAGLTVGDTITIRWREYGGSFNALDARVVQVMRTTVQTVDVGQIWLPLDRLQAMMKLEDQATIIVLGKDTPPPVDVPGWNFQGLDVLLKEFREMMGMKGVVRNIMFIILLALGMLAVFDTQVLSVFRRRKEMGTLMAMGMTRARVIQLFTLEGALHGLLAVVAGAVWGFPLLFYYAKQGFGLPQSTDNFGLALGDKIFPVYGVGLVLGASLLVLVVTTFVSFLPTRKIAKLKPTDALRGSRP